MVHLILQFLRTLSLFLVLQSLVQVTAPREMTFMFTKGFLRHTMNKSALKYLQKYNTISVYLVVFRESLTQNLSVFKRNQGRNIGMLFSCSLRTVREVVVRREVWRRGEADYKATFLYTRSWRLWTWVGGIWIKWLTFCHVYHPSNVHAALKHYIVRFESMQQRALCNSPSYASFFALHDTNV